MEVNNDFLIKLDAEAMLMLMDKEYGGTGKKLSEISFLEFRKYLYKKYYEEESEDGDTSIVINGDINGCGKFLSMHWCGHTYNQKTLLCLNCSQSHGSGKAGSEVNEIGGSL